MGPVLSSPAERRLNGSTPSQCMSSMSRHPRWPLHRRYADEHCGLRLGILQLLIASTVLLVTIKMRLARRKYKSTKVLRPDLAVRPERRQRQTEAPQRGSCTLNRCGVSPSLSGPNVLDEDRRPVRQQAEPARCTSRNTELAECVAACRKHGTEGRRC